MATVGGVSDETTTDSIRARMRAALTAAMKERDMPSVRAIRSALGAIDNAEAVDSTVEPERIDAESTIAGAVAGGGSTEVRRQTLDEDAVTALLLAEATDRLAAADEYSTAGATERAELLRAEAATISAFTVPAGR